MRVLKKKAIRSRGTASVSENKKEVRCVVSDETGELCETDGTLVSVGAGITVSENYSSVRAEVSITVPTIWSQRETAAAEGWKFVDKELGKHLRETRKVLGKITS